jgi:hypothetical protein
MWDLQISPNPRLRRLLESHPRVTSIDEVASDSVVAWDQSGWKRAIFVGPREGALKGVVELTDNNPLVCADSFCLPTGAATLAALALGPLAEAGLIVERPTMLVNDEATEEEIGPFLADMGWTDGLTVEGGTNDLAGAIAATVICAVVTPDRLEDLDDLFDQRYERSFFVQREEISAWDVNLVIGKPYAVYRLRLAPDEPHSLLTIQIMADREGKCGASQIVHAFNVMCGFEESLGLG